MRQIILTILVTLILFTAPEVLNAGKPGYLELKTAREAFRGRLVVKNSQSTWLMSREGKLHEVQLRSVKSFKKMNSTFRPDTTRNLRLVLQKELGKDYEIAVAGQYIVAAAPGRAKAYAAVCDELYRSFQRYFSTRGFKVKRPEFPLVAIVFRSRDEFATYCQGDKFQISANLAGYYHPLTNRVALFERNGNSLAANGAPVLHSTLVAKVQSRQMDNRVHDTLIHEATHQVAYNAGLHRRVGDTPRWIVEGLATMFEPEGARQNSRRGSVMNRVNKDRYLRFGNFAKLRRKKNSLKAFIQNDSMYKSNTLDFYAQAWALSFFLCETRPREYARYLITIAQRPDFSQYTAKERLADFQSVFGKKTDWLETKFLRYMTRLK